MAFVGAFRLQEKQGGRAPFSKCEKLRNGYREEAKWGRGQNLSLTLQLLWQNLYLFSSDASKAPLFSWASRI